MNAKFVKIFRKYCKYTGMDWNRAKNLFNKSSVDLQEKYKEEILLFIKVRKEVENKLLKDSSVVLPVNTKPVRS